MVTKITDLSDVPIVEYVYDDTGFRYKKKNYTGGILTKTTLYIRDISGQIASIYEKTTGVYSLEEVPFYGSSRIGSLHKNTTLASDDAYYYELKDHLGNVRQTIKVEGVSKIWANHKSDYYPFGMKFLNVNSYRYGYQGEYAEDETGEDGIKANSFQLRLYNPRLGRWLSPDPYRQFHSPYLAMGNSPTNSVDPDGGYSKFGAKWRAFFGGGEAFDNGDGVWGIQKSGFDSDGDWGFTSHFGKDSHEKVNTHNYFSLNGNSFLVPKDHGSLSIKKYNNWGQLKRIPDLRAKMIYDFSNAFYTTGQFMIGRAVDRGMVNLDGTFSTTDDAVLGLAEVGLTVIGIQPGQFSVKPLRGRGGNLNGFTVSKGAGYGAKPRFDVHPLGGASKATNTMPRWTRGKTLPHYHIGRGNNLRRHRPWESSPRDNSFFDRFW